jgi:hypothetical protein
VPTGSASVALHGRYGSAATPKKSNAAKNN